jgi:GDPmannose 4,6-dehydratase
MGHSMVDFYRNTYGLPFSNGVIFTTESPLKKPVFLLNKIAEHIKEWKKGKKEALKVGNLDSYRNIIHASDVASAIHSILSQSSGNNYLICNEESHKICDLVIELYSLSSIEIELKDNLFYEKNSGLQIMFIEDIYTGTDSTPINIRGEANHLNKIGWKPLLSKSDILHQLL